MKCPGQDSRYWKAGAIFEAKCLECDHLVEFFKDNRVHWGSAAGAFGPERGPSKRPHRHRDETIF